MPAVTGYLKDLVGDAMADREGVIVFRPNAAMVQATSTTPGTIHSTAEKRIKPDANGSFSVNLTATTIMLTDAYYTLRIEWVDGSGPALDYPDWQIRVPVGSGGHIGEFITIGPPNGGWGGSLPNLSLVMIAETQPDNLQVGQLWLQATPGEHANPDRALNTGKLYRGKL